MNFKHAPQLHIVWHRLGLREYALVWNAMQHFTNTRSCDTQDEIWTLQHPPVYTLGQAGDKKHILNSTSIPIIHTDRGGQTTYHGPGQLIAYILYDLRRGDIGIKNFVWHLEQAVINLLADNRIQATRLDGAPGIYVAKRKIASIGLRIRKGYSFHGVSLNCNMNLEPFENIITCGNDKLKMIQMSDLITIVNIEQVEQDLARHLALQLNLIIVNN
jgi:lipoyl(octanoyl) transferase